MSLDFTNPQVNEFIETELAEGSAPIGNKRDVFSQLCRAYSLDPEGFDYRGFLTRKYQAIQANQTLNTCFLSLWRDTYREVRNSLEVAERNFAH